MPKQIRSSHIRLILASWRVRQKLRPAWKDSKIFSSGVLADGLAHS